MPHKPTCWGLVCKTHRCTRQITARRPEVVSSLPCSFSSCFLLLIQPLLPTFLIPPVLPYSFSIYIAYSLLSFFLINYPAVICVFFLLFLSSFCLSSHHPISVYSYILYPALISLLPHFFFFQSSSLNPSFIPHFP